jgi:predicted pyridoxine 5'-phosphate oxidase superfamily flavin-nucleotide-binding protein
MATVSETGWPYVQHRGDPPGFVKVLGPNLIGFADFKGNRQLVSTGKLDITDRVALFMMDYPRRTRLKLLGHARVLDARELLDSRFSSLLTISIPRTKDGNSTDHWKPMKLPLVCSLAKES